MAPGRQFVFGRTPTLFLKEVVQKQPTDVTCKQYGGPSLYVESSWKYYAVGGWTRGRRSRPFAQTLRGPDRQRNARSFRVIVALRERRRKNPFFLGWCPKSWDGSHVVTRCTNDLLRALSRLDTCLWFEKAAINLDLPDTGLGRLFER